MARAMAIRCRNPTGKVSVADLPDARIVTAREPVDVRLEVDHPRRSARRLALIGLPNSVRLSSTDPQTVAFW